MHREDRADEGTYRHCVFTMTPRNQSPYRLILKYWRQHKNSGVILTYLRTVHHAAVGYDIDLHWAIPLFNRTPLQMTIIANVPPGIIYKSTPGQAYIIFPPPRDRLVNAPWASFCFVPPPWTSFYVVPLPPGQASIMPSKF